MEDRMQDGHEMMHGPGGGWEVVEALGTLVAFLLLAGLLVLVVWGAYRLLVRPRVGAREDPAVGILRERLARGEVSAEEYEITLEILRESRMHEQSATLGSPEAGSPRRTYEDYVRDAMSRLKFGRNAGS